MDDENFSAALPHCELVRRVGVGLPAHQLNRPRGREEIGVRWGRGGGYLVLWNACYTGGKGAY